MAKGIGVVKTKPALDLLSGVCKGKKLSLNEIIDTAVGTIHILYVRTEHPPAVPLHHECLITDCASTPAHFSVIFKASDGSVICAAALWAFGAAGPSGVGTIVGNNNVQVLSLPLMNFVPLLLL